LTLILFDVGEHNLSILGGHSLSKKPFVVGAHWFNRRIFPADTGIEPRNNPGLAGIPITLDIDHQGSTYLENELQSYCVGPPIGASEIDSCFTEL